MVREVEARHDDEVLCSDYCRVYRQGPTQSNLCRGLAACWFVKVVDGGRYGSKRFVMIKSLPSASNGSDEAQASSHVAQPSLLPDASYFTRASSVNVPRNTSDHLRALPNCGHPTTFFAERPRQVLA